MGSLPPVDIKLMLALAVLAAFIIAEVRERRANAARAREAATAPPPRAVEPITQMQLEPGRRYRVVKAFTDHDRDAHPEGEEWTFLRSAFVPYHSGMSWFVSFDGLEETHIRLQAIPEEQGEILDNLADYLVAVYSAQ